MDDRENAVTVEKRKKTRTCRDCGSNLAGDAGKCQNCDSTNIKKTEYVIRKRVSNDVPSAEDEVPDYEEMEETEKGSAPPEQDSAEKLGVYLDDSEDDDEDDAEDEEEEKEAVRMKKSIAQDDLHVIGAEVATLALAAAEKVVKSLTSEDPETDYETAMNDVNNALDVAVEEWREGSPVEKAGDKLALLKQKKKLLQRKLALLTGEDDDEEVGKSSSDSEDIYKGLSPEVVKRLRAADELVEKNAAAEWETIAKGFTHVPADYAALGKALRTLAAADKDAFETIKTVLSAADTNLANSDVFKSFGSSRVNTGSDADELTVLAKGLVEKGTYPTVEQAAAALMDLNPEKYYQPTVS